MTLPITPPIANAERMLAALIRTVAADDRQLASHR